MLWAIFVPKTDEVTGGLSNLHKNRYTNCNIHQMNEIKEDGPHIQLVKGLEIKRPRPEADCSHLVPSLPHNHLWRVCRLTVAHRNSTIADSPPLHITHI